jgi:homocysteine S-methyltransferase
MLAAFVRDLKGSLHHGPFKVFAALNINAVNFDAQLSYAKKKTANGVSGFLTQPVHSLQALENLKRARGSWTGSCWAASCPSCPPQRLLYEQRDFRYHRVRRHRNAVPRFEPRRSLCAGRDTVVQAAHDMAAFVNGYYIITPFPAPTW